MHRVIELKDVAIGYKAYPVASHIDATLAAGDFVALVGRNGAGKSTLLRTLAGYQQPLAGEILYCGEPAGRMSPVRLSKQIAVVLTENNAALNLTVRELVALGRSPYTNFVGYLRAVDKECVEWAIEAVGIGSIAERRVLSLSDGERQKCMIAKALAQETPVIMLDEPTAFLDFGSKVALFALLKKLAAEMNKAVLVSTHDIELAMRVAGGLWLVDGGAVHCGTVEELSRNGVLKRFIECDGVKFNERDCTLEFGY